MARLIVNPGSPNASVIELNPGQNTLGRGTTADFQVHDPSVSTLHCRIDVGEAAAEVTDLGSTNGTFVDGVPVAGLTPLAEAQVLRLGNVEFRFETDPVYPVAAGREPQPPVEQTPVPARTLARQPITAVVPPASSAPARGGREAAPAHCKHHPGTVARYLCPSCGQHYCEICVTTRMSGGKAEKTCRHCGVPCQAVSYRLQAPLHKGFFARLPGAFLYPARGSGVFLVIVGVVLVALVRGATVLIQWGSLRSIIMGGFLLIFVLGYLFSFLQAVIHSSATEEKEMPDLPGVANAYDDVIIPFVRFFGLALLCFTPAFAAAIWAASSDNQAAGWVVDVALIFGAIYFPMAFLAVAVFDTITAANPLLVVTSILKVPFQYLTVLLLIAGFFAFRALGFYVIAHLFPEDLSTHSMGMLLGFLAMQALWGLAGFYLLIVATHVLGLIYAACKQRLAWFSHM